MNMPNITLKADNIVKEVPEGTPLRDVCERNEASLPFGCKEGICGTCLCTVEEGMENLSEKTENENQTLEAFGADENQRLACQCKIKGDIIIDY